MNDYIGETETLEIGQLIRPPLAQHAQLIFNHFARYAYAIKSLNLGSDDTVIDASCGQGYGSYVLSNVVKQVVGLDTNQSYINLAKKFFQKDNINFLTYEEFCGLKKRVQKRCDKIVCVETLEHLQKDNLRPFIDMLISFLKAGGSMYVTVPLGKDGPSDYNKYHPNEPSLQTLYEIFVKRFKFMTVEIRTFKNSFGHVSEYAQLVLNQYLESEK